MIALRILQDEETRWAHSTTFALASKSVTGHTPTARSLAAKVHNALESLGLPSDSGGIKKVGNDGQNGYLIVL
jgi:hypothetical protein